MDIQELIDAQEEVDTSVQAAPLVDELASYIDDILAEWGMSTNVASSVELVTPDRSGEVDAGVRCTLSNGIVIDLRVDIRFQ